MAHILLHIVFIEVIPFYSAAQRKDSRSFLDNSWKEKIHKICYLLKIFIVTEIFSLTKFSRIEYGLLLKRLSIEMERINVHSREKSHYMALRMAMKEERMLSTIDGCRKKRKL